MQAIQKQFLKIPLLHISYDNLKSTSRISCFYKTQF